MGVLDSSLRARGKLVWRDGKADPFNIRREKLKVMFKSLNLKVLIFPDAPFQIPLWGTVSQDSTP